MMLYVGTPTAHLIVALVWIFALVGIILTLVFWAATGRYTSASTSSWDGWSSSSPHRSSPPAGA